MKTTRIRALIAASGGGGTISSITGLQAALDGKAALSHTQAISTVTGLQTALDGKQASGSYASATHTHAQSDVTNLVSDLAGKAASTHTHAQSDVTGLVTALSGKAASSHTHAQSDITNLTTDLAAKQATLVSATNIKTINGASVLGSGDLTVAASVYTLVATLASDQATAANTTPVTLTGLVFSYEANSKYRIWFMGRIQPTAATTGCGFQFDLSSAVTSIDVAFFHQLANTGTLSGGHSIADDASVGISSGMPGTSTYPVTGQGLLITTSNTGTAQLRFRSETTAVTTAKAGFTLVVEKIA